MYIKSDLFDGFFKNTEFIYSLLFNFFLRGGGVKTPPKIRKK